MHGGPDSVPVAQIKIIAHPDLFAVIDDRRARHRKQQAVHQLNLFPVIPQERGQTAPDSQIDPGLLIMGKDAVHVIPLFIRHHFQGELVVIAQKESPLAGFRNGRCLFQDIDNRKSIFHLHGHEEPWHQGEMKVHMAFVAIPEIGGGIFRPLIGLRQKQAVFEFFIDVRPECFEKRMGFREVFAIGAFPLVEIRHGVQPQTVHAHVQPEIQDFKDGLLHIRVVVIEIRLVGEKAMPEIGFGHRVPGPI